MWAAGGRPPQGRWETVGARRRRTLTSTRTWWHTGLDCTVLYATHWHWTEGAQVRPSRLLVILQQSARDQCGREWREPSAPIGRRRHTSARPPSSTCYVCALTRRHHLWPNLKPRPRRFSSLLSSLLSLSEQSSRDKCTNRPRVHCDHQLTVVYSQIKTMTSCSWCQSFCAPSRLQMHQGIAASAIRPKLRCWQDYH